ncbi:MAG TPA: wax ester/triacylglycerol synthase family O-acyltransferase [Acidimicrobiales bacterium]|jgi:WS/DGAT/MGAT family acyltransferase|nr:wax ester/triacylglycerol synthase family O-acyltransferase [Acidimicrobiales bacterium]
MPENTMRPLRGDRRMSDVEALMWNLEKDPALASSFANVTILDQPPDHARLRRTMERAVKIVPRLRQRVVPAFGRLAPPEWQDDPDFDLDYHIRRVALPAPADDRALFDLAATLAAAPLDRTRPLWEFTIVDGLAGGRAALFQKLHHTITDGEGGVRMSAEFIDFGRDDQDRPEPAVDTDRVAERAASSLVSTLVETTTHNVRRTLGIARRAVANAADLALHPDKVPVVGSELLAAAQSFVRQASVTDHARSPLWTERSLRRRFEVLRIPLDDTKRAAKTLGGSVNDIFVAGAAAAAGAYHRAKGAEVDELRVTMPVSTRTDRSMGGNAFTPARLTVPVAGASALEQFAVIRDRLTATKGERALEFADALAGVINVLPTSVLVRIARQQVETVDFASSNVRGAPFDLYIAGALILANYPMGPTGGTAFNLTVLSSGGWLDMGVNIDTAAVDDPELLRTCLEESYAELLRAD